MKSTERATKHRTELGLRFATTAWTDIAAARQADLPGAAAALEKLCTTYWYPVYAFLRRKQCDPDQAQDLTQEFFYRLLKTDLLGVVDRQKGKFRSFLLVVVRRFLNDERNRQRALKRGGGQTILSLDAEDAESRYLREPTCDLAPDKAYEQAWFRTLLDQVLARLQAENVAAGKGTLFERLKVFLEDDSKPGAYPAVASELGMKPNAVAVAVFRLKQRYQELAREEISRTVSEPEHIESEMRHLLRLFG